MYSDSYTRQNDNIKTVIINLIKIEDIKKKNESIELKLLLSGQLFN